MLADVPRRVWFHWMQGRSEMPPVVRECLASWIRRNPDWEVVFLDRESVWTYLDRDTIPVDALVNTSPQVYANAIRFRLLSQHGGVWADATTWCVTPLSEWLTRQPGEFFAFASPGPDRMLSTWFLASEKDGYVVRAMGEQYVRLFEKFGPLTVLPDSTVSEMLSRAANTDVFFAPQLLATERRYPYFLCHYLFAFLYRRDERFKRIWDATSKVGADPSHAAQSIGLVAPADAAATRAVRAANPRIHKLNWRIDPIEPGMLLHAIVTGAV